MKPYGFDAVGGHAWPYERPGKPHDGAQDSARVNRAAARRRPKRAERQRAQREIAAEREPIDR